MNIILGGKGCGVLLCGVALVKPMFLSTTVEKHILPCVFPSPNHVVPIHSRMCMCRVGTLFR